MRNVFLAIGLASALILSACHKKNDEAAPAEAAPAPEAAPAAPAPAPEAAPAPAPEAAPAAPAEAPPAQ